MIVVVNQMYDQVVAGAQLVDCLFLKICVRYGPAHLVAVRGPNESRLFAQGWPTG
jgi:hypothetical protein